MSQKKNYNEKSVTDLLKKNPDIKVNIVNKSLEIVIDSDRIGNSTWGKIDYLAKVHGYTVTRVPKKK